MEELLAGRLTFKVKNSQGNIVNGTVVQYQSSDYYVQADGSLLWQVQAIEHSSNTVILTGSQTISSGFTLVDVQVNVIGAFLRKNEYNSEYLVNEDGQLVCYYYSSGDNLFALNKIGDDYYPIIRQEQQLLFSEWGYKTYGNAQSPTSNFEITVNNVTYNGVFSDNHFTITPDIVNVYQP